MIVGVLGGGQLGRMLALAGYPLGLKFRFLDAVRDVPAAPLGRRITAPFDDKDALTRFARGTDVVTYEFENVPVDSAAFAESFAPVFPPPKALATAQDRLSEKELFTRLGIPVPAYAPVSSPEDLAAAVERIGLPAVLKTRRFGYDGKGQWVLRTPEDVEGARLAAGGGTPLILEQFLPFDRELSIIAVRSRSGELAFYPLVENHHREGILRLSLAPAPHLSAAVTAEAESHARRLLEALDYVGVLTIEFFEYQGRLYANEMAPRVHNSGHWTIEGAETSQFENHLRAILDLPLGGTAVLGAAAMVNLIGALPDLGPCYAGRDVHVHLYDKKPRKGRKLGHLTVRAANPAELAERLAPVRALVEAAGG